MTESWKRAAFSTVLLTFCLAHDASADDVLARRLSALRVLSSVGGATAPDHAPAIEAGPKSPGCENTVWWRSSKYGIRSRMETAIRDASIRHSVDAALIRSVIDQESDYNIHAVSNKGAMGLMQLMPATARSLGVRCPFDPRENVLGGTRYLRRMRDRLGSWSRAVAAYHCGPGCVERGRIPTVTRLYAKRVLRGWRPHRYQSVHFDAPAASLARSGDADLRAISADAASDNLQPGEASMDKPENPFAFDGAAKGRKPQEYYDRIKEKFAEERDVRLGLRPEGTAQFTSDLTGALAKYAGDPYASEPTPREPLNDSVECLFIGGGFSALLTSARLREKGVESIRIVERGADVGGTWYWNRYPGVACDVVAYDYLPLLDEMNYVPSRHYAKGPEIYAHCQAIAKKYDLYDLAVFQTTVTSTLWDEAEEMWQIRTDRGDHMQARFVICANGTLSKPKLSKIEGMETFGGHSFHTSRWDYAYTGADLTKLRDKVVGIIGTGASAVQAVPHLGTNAKELYVFQRTPSSIDIKPDWETDPEWASRLEPGWQARRRARALAEPERTPEQKARRAALSREEKIRRQENANIDAMMRIHRRIEEIVDDPSTAESLKPWYMLMCKRPCFDNDYLPTFNRDNVHLVDTHGEGITEIREAGPAFEGHVYPLDCLIYATGFEVQKTGIYNEIRGKGGLELSDKYRDGVRTVLGIHSSGYPNLFIMGGYQASFRFNLTDVLQTQGDHIAECIAYARREGYHTIDATPEAEEWWVQEVIANRGKTSRAADCTPGYYNFEGESQRRQDGNYNGSYPQYIAHTKDVIERIEERFAFSRRTAS